MKRNRQFEEDEFEAEDGHKSRGFVIFLSILCLIIIGGGSFAGFYFYKTNVSDTKPIEKEYVNAGEITVNLSDDSGKRYVISSVYVGFDKGDKKAKKQLTKEKQLSVVQDALSFCLKNKTSDFFKGDYEESLKAELIDAVNKKVQDFKITDIKLINLVIQ